MSLKQKLARIPKSPGVYFFKDSKGEIIYIGKAKILRNRVRSYFNKPDAKDAKTQVMVKNIAYFDWLVVRSEVEALLTEASPAGEAVLRILCPHQGCFESANLG